MKRFCCLFVMCVMAVSCWNSANSVLTGYISAFQYVNYTEHDIEISAGINSTDMHFVIKPGEKYIQEWEGFFSPGDIEKATVTFNDIYSVSYYSETGNIKNCNICNPSNYIMTKEGKYGKTISYLYTFTERDYDYAVSVSKSEKQ